MGLSSFKGARVYVPKSPHIQFSGSGLSRADSNGGAEIELVKLTMK